MFELVKQEGGMLPYEPIHIFDRLEDAFKEAYFYEENIQWRYVNEDRMIYFEGWTNNDQALPSYIIKTAGITTPIEQPEEAEEEPLI
jgi:hypothetical protein